MDAPNNIRVIPYNLVAEQSVLGAMILTKPALASLCNCSPRGLYDLKIEIFDAILDLFNMDKPLDAITLAEQLKERAPLKKAVRAVHCRNCKRSANNRKCSVLCQHCGGLFPSQETY